MGRHFSFKRFLLNVICVVCICRILFYIWLFKRFIFYVFCFTYFYYMIYFICCSFIFLRSCYPFPCGKIPPGERGQNSNMQELVQPKNLYIMILFCAIHKLLQLLFIFTCILFSLFHICKFYRAINCMFGVSKFVSYW